MRAAGQKGKLPSLSGNSPDIEIELKFLPTEDTFKAIKQSELLGPAKSNSRNQRIHSTYFDTEAGDLRRHRMALRMRRSRDGHLLTLK